jgi:hypothetical protein
MLMLIGAATTNEAEALKLWSAVANAVMVAVLPTIVGKSTEVRGTVNNAGLPAGECLGINPEVQSIVPQVAFQSTPRFAGSPSTVAAMVKVPPEGKTDGGG